MGSVLEPFTKVYNEDIVGLNVLYENKTKVGEKHKFLNSMVVSCCVSDGFKYHHYCMYDELDFGWGCAYRCLQMIVSFYETNFSKEKPEIVVPKIREIQKALVGVKYMPEKVIGSRTWIEPHHAAVYVRSVLGFETREVIYYRYKSTSMEKRKKKVEKSESKRVEEKGFEIIMSEDPEGNDLGALLLQHFQDVRSLVMVDDSIKAYIVGGIRILEEISKSGDEELEGEGTEENEGKKKKRRFQALIFDPHCYKGYSFEDYERVENDTKASGKGVFWVDVKSFFVKVRRKRWMMFFPTRVKILKSEENEKEGKEEEEEEEEEGEMENEVFVKDASGSDEENFD